MRVIHIEWIGRNNDQVVVQIIWTVTVSGDKISGAASYQYKLCVYSFFTEHFAGFSKDAGTVTSVTMAFGFVD